MLSEHLISVKPHLFSPTSKSGSYSHHSAQIVLFDAITSSLFKTPLLYLLSLSRSASLLCVLVRIGQDMLQ